MANILQFVDSISATPTVRLDLNDLGQQMLAREYSISEPPLSRLENVSMLRDGGAPLATVYDNRVVRLPLHLLGAGTSDGLQGMKSELARELNRPTNVIRWQPNGQTAPVFFRTYRSAVQSTSSLLNVNSLADVEILAEPFAYGLRVDQAAVTVTNDPAAASSGGIIDIPTVLGDTETPALIWHESGDFNYVVAARGWGTPSDLEWFQQTAGMTAGTDTTLSVADVTASGGSHSRVTFATNTALTSRLSTLLPSSGATVAAFAAAVGTFRLLVRVRKTVSGDSVQVQGAYVTPYGVRTMIGSPITLASGTAWQVIDLGLVDMPAGVAVRSVGYGGGSIRSDGLAFEFHAGRTSGTGSLDIDYLPVLPADESFAFVTLARVLDGPQQAAYVAVSPNAAQVAMSVASGVSMRGGFPHLVPGSPNRLWWLRNGSDAVTVTTSVNVSYWPRYLSVR